MMKALGKRDVSSREVMHHLLSLKLHSSHFQVFPVSLNGGRRLRKGHSACEILTQDSILDLYPNGQQYLAKIS